MDDEEEAGLVEVSRLIFGPEITCKQARKFWEPSNPTTQCNSIIGKFKKGTICYICGIPITGRVDENNMAGGAKAKLTARSTRKHTSTKTSQYKAKKSTLIRVKSVKKDGLDAECEHILPIADAILYLGLESPQFKGNPYYDRKILDYEYAWAHRTCNQIKSGTSYIDQDKKGQFIVDKRGLTKLLKSIWNTTRSDSVEFKKALHASYTNEDEFVKIRMGEKKPSLIDPFQLVVNYLNKFAAPNLLLLSGICKMVEGELMSEEAKEKLASKDPLVFQRFEEERLRKRETEANELYDQIISQVEDELKITLPKAKFADVYERFYQLAKEVKSIYVADFVRLPFDRSSDEMWTEYVKNIMMTLINKAFKEVRAGEKHRRLEIFSQTAESVAKKVFSEIYPKLRKSLSANNAYKTASETAISVATNATLASATATATATTSNIEMRNRSLSPLEEEEEMEEENIIAAQGLAGLKRRTSVSPAKLINLSNTRKKRHTIFSRVSPIKKSGLKVRVPIKSLSKTLRKKYSIAKKGGRRTHKGRK